MTGSEQPIAGGGNFGSPGRPPLLKWAVRIGALVLGYVVAVGAASLLFAILLHFFSTFESPHMPHGGTKDVLENIAGLALISFLMGLIYGLPYTIVGSLAFWFVLPRKTWIFLLIGTFCPTGALALTGPLLGGQLWADPEMRQLVLFSLVPGLLAAYLYGAIGFRRGFRQWSFA